MKYFYTFSMRYISVVVILIPNKKFYSRRGPRALMLIFWLSTILSLGYRSPSASLKEISSSCTYVNTFHVSQSTTNNILFINRIITRNVSNYKSIRNIWILTVDPNVGAKNSILLCDKQKFVPRSATVSRLSLAQYKKPVHSVYLWNTDWQKKIQTPTRYFKMITHTTIIIHHE